MEGWTMNARRISLLGFLGLLLFAGAGAALPRVADDLPEPLSDVARLPERLWTRLFPPRTPTESRLAGLTDPEREAVRVLGARLDGLLVWSSNRSGNHELYLLDLRTQSIRQLTHTPSVDFFSRFSPDGRQILFSRSQRAWVSFRDPTAWDVFLMNVDGTHERRIVRGGYHPTWAPDGKAVIFERQRRFLRYDLATGQESVLLDGPLEFPGVEYLGDVEMGPDGRRLAFVLRGRFAGAHGLTGAYSGAVVFDLETRRLASLTQEQACQTTWAPDGQRLLWMEPGGNGGTRVMTGRPDGSGREVFVDLPGAYSHEYFPRLASDGRWLVWGASARGHEHDRADYEIFVWEAGTGIEQAVRLTHHEGNDQWPDLWVRPRG
jgi:Tol biopolymer transport system component